MTDKPKTIQEALAEVQRKVNEERVAKTKAEWEAVEEGTALVPYNAVKQTDWRTVSNVPKVAKAAPVSSTSGIPKVASALGRFAGPIATGASIGATASDLLGAASRTETGRNVGRWIRDNVPGAPAAAEAMKKAGEAIGVREPSKPTTTTTPASTTSTTAVPTPPKRPSQTDLNKMSRDKALKDSGSKYAAGKPHSVTTLSPTAPGQQGKVQSRTTEKGWADPGRWENEAKAKTGSMQQIRGGKVLPPSSQLGTPKDEKSTQSFLDKELGRTPAASSTPATTQTPAERWAASKKETGVSDTTAKAQTTAVQSQPSGQKSTSDFLKSQGVGVSTEDGKKKKMSEETNPLISAFLNLQQTDARNVFEAAKKLSKKQDEKLDVVDDDKIDAKDFAALRAGKKGKMEEESVDHLGSSTVTKEKKGYVDPSTPTKPYEKAPMSTAAGDVLSKAKNALDKTGVREEDESLFSEAELEHFKSVFNEASVAPNRPEVATEARPDSVKDGVSQNDVTGTHTESGKKKTWKEETLHEAGMPSSVIKHKEKIRMMTDDQKKEYFKDKTQDQLKAMAWRHGYGKDSNEYAKHGTVKEETLEEGRPRKNPVASEEESPVKNIAAQVRTARSVTNDGGKSYHIPLKHPVSGKVHHVPQKAVDDFNKSYAAARKADDKEAVETAFKAKHMSE